MKRFYIAAIALMGFAVTSYAGVSFGLKGGYTYGSLTPKEIHETMTIGSETFDTTFTPDSAETENPAGFGGELFCDIGFPGVPVTAEVGVGYYTESFTPEEAEEGEIYKMNSIKISALGKYFIPGVPVVSPWVAVGPFLGLNTHSSETEDTTITGSMVPNFGVTCGAGVRVGIMPKISIYGGVLFDYFITSKAKFTFEDFYGCDELIYEPSYNQWNLNISAGVSWSIL